MLALGVFTFSSVVVVGVVPGSSVDACNVWIRMGKREMIWKWQLETGGGFDVN